jgi:NADPH-dependent 2,4-dienoyl-CoA reductase/sulfur reductase-like enzyme
MTSPTVTEVAIVGAGPYGLSLAAYLRERGIVFRIFGSPMTFWLGMPATIQLKSFAFATNIFVPRPHFTFPEYCRSRGLEDSEPCSMASFAAYGLWVQRELLPEVEAVDVTDVRARGGHFDLTLRDGSLCRARCVVVATGLSGFAYLPDVLTRLPAGRVSHSSEHVEYSKFAGEEVAVVGAGASALETATMLLEAGARPLLLARSSAIVFHTKMNPRRSLLERLRNPNSVLGPGRKSWALQHFPALVHYVPEARRVRFTRSYLGPSGPWWLHDRFRDKVPFRLESRVVGAEAKGERVSLQVSEKGEAPRALEVDHVIAGTGYEVDVDRIPFLDPDLRARLRRVSRAPALSRHFESSVPGLYFVGAASAFSFGPLLRFVAGAAYASPTVTKHIATTLRHDARIVLGTAVARE